MLTVCFLLITALLCSCAPQPKSYVLEAPPPYPVSNQVPITRHACDDADLNPLLESGGYIQRVDNFLIILDSSSTMSEHQEEGKLKSPAKLELAKDIIRCINTTIPYINMTGGLRTFGKKDELVYGMEGYMREGLDAALDLIPGTGGISPLAGSINAATADLQGTSGETAVLVFSDGMNTDTEPAVSGAALKQAYGDGLCIYTIHLGTDKNGRQVLENVASAGQCGFAGSSYDFSYVQHADGSKTGNPSGTVDFVKKVFLKHAPDSDGDGVYDSNDKCPGTPAGMKVDSSGCPLDSDKDGVYDYLDKCLATPAGVKVDGNGCPKDSDRDGVADYLDKCPATPRSIKVDAVGCPVPIPEKVSIELKVEFDFDKSDIKPAYHDHLSEVADFLKAYPDTTAVFEGHTCNIGTETYNLGLSKRRADSVMNYLINNFSIDPKRLTTKAYGSSQPIASNATEAGREKNRRVMATITTTIMKIPE
jgi:OOP family OmpA-OmpF porin